MNIIKIMSSRLRYNGIFIEYKINNNIRCYSYYNDYHNCFLCNLKIYKNNLVYKIFYEGDDNININYCVCKNEKILLYHGMPKNISNIMDYLSSMLVKYNNRIEK